MQSTMQQLDIASISILIASISVVVGVILSIVQIRQQTETRQAALFMDIYRQVSSEFVENISRSIALFERIGLFCSSTSEDDDY